MSEHWRVLVVDDEHVVRESMADWLCKDGYVVDQASSGREALDLVEAHDYLVCFVDLKMPGGMDGLDTMAELRARKPRTTTVIVTAFATIATAVRAMKEGAEDYLVKPCNLHHVSALVRRIIRYRLLEDDNEILRKKLTRSYRFHDIISKSPAMDEVFRLVRDVADLRTTVLIGGDSGTGKEMIARAIHQEGCRRDARFVAVPCAALSETLLESELFGYARGAFTGASEMRKGKIELADGGTLFLDEIGDVSPKLQIDLLRFLQERTFYRVGGNQELKVDVRVIAATHRDLPAAVRSGEFRADLFYRLNVVHIGLPPLRERLEDIPLLAQHFINRVSSELGRSVTGVHPDAVRILMRHEWPGNVRELENAMERAIISARSPLLTESDFAFLVEQPELSWMPPGTTTLAELERRAIIATLNRTRDNVKQAAQILGIDRSTLYCKLRLYEIERPSKEP